MAIEDSPNALHIYNPPITDDELDAATAWVIHSTRDAPGRAFAEGFPKAIEFLEGQDADYWKILDLSKITLEAAGYEVIEGSDLDVGMVTGFFSAIEILVRVAEARNILGRTE